ncbi:MAG: hypothetical protein RIR62_2595 [Pseudomonadota bacterium]
MRMLALTLTLALPAAPAAAALSGFYDSAEKIAAIFAADAVADALRQAPVRSVENTGTTPEGDDEWTIRTQDCDLKLRLVAEPPTDGMVGMTTYRAEPLGGCE